MPKFSSVTLYAFGGALPELERYVAELRGRADADAETVDCLAVTVWTLKRIVEAEEIG